MHLIHPVQGLEHGSCSRNVTVISFWTLFWGPWECLMAFEKESDIRALHMDIVR